MPTPAVRLQRVSRRFGSVRAVEDVSLEIANGEFFAMLGPSGSGKTTCLRLISGFDQPTSGHIEIHGNTAEGVPPYERDVNTVFQDYALFPHMSVIDNVSYGLMVRGESRSSRYARAAQMLAMVKLEGMEQRRPAALSGGQRQRVALARALINHPRVLLLDEPLGALDLKLREQMQVELKALQRKLGITFVYVTHDQEEALSMSDRLAVMNEGRIEQVGAPDEVYDHPTTRFVASFVGHSNIVEGAAAMRLGTQACAFALRPERILMLAAGAEMDVDMVRADGVVSAVQYHGASTRFVVSLDCGVELTVTRQNARRGDGVWGSGARVRLAWREGDMQRLGDGETA